jgi:putative CocE/NonD family hydrolase
MGRMKKTMFPTSAVGRAALVICAVAASLSLGLSIASRAFSQQQTPAGNLTERYLKTESQIPMRDGKRLYTIIYTPRDASQKYPILLQRTPYGVGPYGAAYKPSLGPSAAFAEEGYIFAYQDVRGTFMSEGEFEDVRPYMPNKKSKNEIDEASDAYDTIEWLLANVPNHNGRVGMWGISYPGFYTAAALAEPHPALKAASPQAPIADWFLGDDDHHNGVLFVMDCFSFNAFFGMPRPAPTQNQFQSFDYGDPDAYHYYLKQGPVGDLMKYFKGQNKYINDVLTHGTYDEHWQARSVPPTLKKVTPAVMTVGGWFDAEDLYGALNIYGAIEKNNPKTSNILVMGPWSHGQWAGGPGESLGAVRFGAPTSAWYRANVELPFFNYHLKDKGPMALPEATVFQTGGNEWRQFDQWPPRGLETKSLYLHGHGALSFEAPREAEGADEYVSDPARPVPYTNEISNRRGTGYMIEDQRFAAQRPDVLVYQTEILREDLTLAGPITADLFVSTTGTDADFVVKVIDVYPNDAPNNSAIPNVKMGGFQMLVRAEIMRGKFRKSFSAPEAFVPNQPAEVKFGLNDVLHTFKAGHRLMVQIQSSWFPLADRNPQKFVDIYSARAADFQKATHRIFHSAKLGSHLKIGVVGK